MRAKSLLLQSGLSSLLMLSTGYALAVTKSAPFDLSKMTAFMQMFRAHAVLPDHPDVEYQTLVKASGPTPPALEELFEKIELEATGDAHFEQLRMCRACAYHGDYRNRVIYAAESDLKEVIKRYGEVEGQLVIAFVLAHEVAHSIQESSIDLDHGVLDINGLPSFINFEQDPSPDRALRLALTHAEIDVYALLLMKKMGLARPLKAADYVALMTDDEDDKRARVSAIRQYMPLIWSE